MKKIDYRDVAGDVIHRIQPGVFLTVKAGAAVNTMTIGWGTIGYCWRKPVFMVAVRDSRHTFTIIEKATDFTVSFPSTDMKKAVAYCGTKSGRDVDKFQECGLDLVDSQQVVSPIIDTPGLHFECRILCKTPMDPALLDPETDTNLYKDKDYHTLYFGEIMECYEI